MKNEFKNYAYIIVGVLMASLGINIFLVPNELVSGGITGLGIIIMHWSQIRFGVPFPISLTNIILNVPLFVLAYKYFGGSYIKRSIAATIIFSAALQLTSYLPEYSGDLMLAAVFGGMIMGLGIGLVLNGSATTGGTETAAHIIHYKSDRLSVSDYIFVIDTAVILLGLYNFGAERAMFAIISVFVSAKCIDAVSSGSSLDKAAVIISERASDIAAAVKESLGREITALNYNNGNELVENNCCTSLICVFSQKEIPQLKEMVKSVDTFAFIILFDIKDVYGAGFKKL